jgi:16S rRNA (uracil1498-N3)-methyltransferase
MHRIFVAPDQINHQSGHVIVSGQDHIHLARVLRARVGDSIVALDGLGSAYQAVLTTIGKTESVADIREQIRPPQEPAILITVAQALGKSDKFETVVQHGTEAGASRFVPVIAERSIVEIPRDRVEARLARWQAIAKGAAEQSFRARIPDIAAPARLADVIVEFRRLNAAILMLHTSDECVSLQAALHRMPSPPAQITICVGPEGGWSASEVDHASNHGAEQISLGPHVLRTETAALVAISQLLYHFTRSGEGTSCVS